MSNIRGSQWSRLTETPFRIENNRRKYRCAHGRRQDSCRECGGLKLAVRCMFYSARTRARRDGVPFTISQAEIWALVGDGICPVLGIRYEFATQKGQGGCDSSPSLDRFYPERGYVAGNCFVISSLANRIKNSATSQQVAQVAAWMQQITEKMESVYVG